MLVFAYISFLIYSGLVLGIYLKFIENGIRIVAFRSYTIVLLLPLIIICLHTIAAIKYACEQRIFTPRIIIFPIANFPLMVGMFIELLLEKKAQDVASKTRAEDKTRRVNKKIRGEEPARETVGFGFNVIKDAASLYKKKLIPKEVM